MRILTDVPEAASSFFPGVAVSAWLQSELPAAEREMVRALGLERVFGGDAAGTSDFWSHCILISETRWSQFDALHQLLGRGHVLAGPTLSLALAGRHFRGQRRRAWVGAAGNIHLTVALPTRLWADHVGGGLSMLPAVACVDAVMEVTAGTVRPAIKWVNDLMIADRKVAGVLTAARTVDRRIDSVIWGIGVNVTVAPELEPTPFVPGAASLRQQAGGGHVTVPGLFWALAGAIERRYCELLDQGPAALLDAYRQQSQLIGRSVTVWEEADCADRDPSRWGPPLAEGVVAHIAADLSLRLHGHAEPVDRGRLAVHAVAPRGLDLQHRCVGVADASCSADS